MWWSDSVFKIVMFLGFILMVTGCTIAVQLKNLVMHNAGLLVGIAAYIYGVAVITYSALRRETPHISEDIGYMLGATIAYAIVLYFYSWGNFFVINRVGIGIGTLICLNWFGFLFKKKTKKMIPR